MNLYLDQFSEKHDYPKFSQPSKILIIASTARCGSHMLGHALKKTSCFGFPLEYVHPDNLSKWKSIFKTENLFDTLREIQHRRTSPNGVFGIKIHYSHIKQFGKFGQLNDFLPNAYYVLLSREDVLKQAISLSIATQTGVWIAGQKPTNANPRYSFEDIDNCLRSIIKDNASWRYLLASNECKSLEMNFDFVRHNLPDAIQDIAKFTDIKVAPQDVPEKQVTQKQSNDINTEWEKKFLSEAHDNELFKINKLFSLSQIKRKLKLFSDN